MNKEKFKQEVYKKCEKELNKKNTSKYLNIYKRVAIFIIVVACSISVYAAIDGNINMEKMGFLKLSKNYDQSSMSINKDIDNEYFTLTLDSIAGDNAYIIALYKIKLKDKALNEFRKIEYYDMIGYNLKIENKVFIDGKQIKGLMEYVNKDSESEYTYIQVINVMDITNNKINLEIQLDELYIKEHSKISNEVKIDKVIKTVVEQKRKENKKIKPIELELNDNIKIIVEEIANTKFENFIKIKTITNNITFKEYRNKHSFNYNNFIITDEHNEPIPYTVYSNIAEETKIYLENDSNPISNISELYTKDNENSYIKVEENYTIIINPNKNIEKIRIVPIEKTLYNDRNNEERNFYNQTEWYPLKTGNVNYTKESSLGGVLEINKIEVDDERIIFYYNTKGIIGDESKVLLRMNNGTMNYIYPVKTEIQDINSKENKIIFERKPTMSSGLNTHTIDFSDIEKIEFTMLYGSTTRIIGKSLEINIPTMNQETSIFNDLLILDN